MARKKSKRTAVLIVALLAALAITSVGWALAESRPKSSGALPENIYDWTAYFHGYEAYLDRQVFGSIVHGTSMSPTFSENDLLLWVRVDPSELKVGDVIIFLHPTLPGIDNVAHRIMEIQNDVGNLSFRTKGDNFDSPDRYFIPAANVHGLVIGVAYHDNSS